MPYTTQADLEERYGTQLLVSLTDRAEAATGTIDADVVSRAIADADAAIDGYIKSRYVLPLETTPALIASLSRQIAIYTLHPYEPDPKIRRDYDGAIAMLRDIAKGTVELDVAGITPDQSDAGRAQVTDRERPFTEKTMKGFI